MRGSVERAGRGEALVDEVAYVAVGERGIAEVWILGGACYAS